MTQHSWHGLVGNSARGVVRALDDVDQALVHALQIAPRAGWNEIGAVLGLDAVTVARRWHRLTDAGAAWISCSPSPALAATGQGGCLPSSRSTAPAAACWPSPGPSPSCPTSPPSNTSAETATSCSR
ncbi:AsnC family protein [Streptomyces sp. NPDC088394]|uniref:AsnC family protein n=1 Tax=Streptomyces sp. NPDC088394 TaxID=3365860 RepID=UPI0038186B59